MEMVAHHANSSCKRLQGSTLYQSLGVVKSSKRSFKVAKKIDDENERRPSAAPRKGKKKKKKGKASATPTSRNSKEISRMSYDSS